MIVRCCAFCGNEFSIPAAWLRKGGGAGTYCSRKCLQAAWDLLRSDGLSPSQRSYRKHAESRRGQQRAQYADNKDKERDRRKKFREANHELVLIRGRMHDANPERKARKAQLERTEKRKAMRRAYRLENPRTEYSHTYESNYRERRKELHNAKQASDPQYRLRRALRARLKQAIKKGYKNGSAVKELGCSVGGLRAYLEAQFAPGMTWDNFGRLDASGRTWQIDHFHPLSSFDLTDHRQLREACHFSNLRPMWAIDNRRKGNRSMRRKEVPNDLLR